VPWVDDFILTPMRGLQRQLNVPPRTSTGIDQALLLKPCERGGIERGTLALHVRSEGSTHIRALFPAQTEPAQILEHGGGKLRPTTFLVQIFAAQNKNAFLCSRPFLSEPKRPGVPEVQVTRGRWRQSSTITR
jgi:hypothetical protein